MHSVMLVMKYFYCVVCLSVYLFVCLFVSGVCSDPWCDQEAGGVPDRGCE